MANRVIGDNFDAEINKLITDINDKLDIVASIDPVKAITFETEFIGLSFELFDSLKEIQKSLEDLMEDLPRVEFNEG